MRRDWIHCAASSIAARLDAPDVAVIDLATDLAHVPAATVDSVALASGVRVTRRTAPFTTVAPRSRRTSRRSRAYSLTSGPGAAKSRAGLCPGDSGGALYKSRDGQLVVVVVASNYTLGPEGKDSVGLPITNWHTRLDASSKHAVAAWLRSLGVPTL